MGHSVCVILKAASCYGNSAWTEAPTYLYNNSFRIQYRSDDGKSTFSSCRLGSYPYKVNFATIVLQTVFERFSVKNVYCGFNWPLMYENCELWNQQNEFMCCITKNFFSVC